MRVTPTVLLARLPGLALQVSPLAQGMQPQVDRRRRIILVVRQSAVPPQRVVHKPPLSAVVPQRVARRIAHLVMAQLQLAGIQPHSAPARMLLEVVRPHLAITRMLMELIQPHSALARRLSTIASLSGMLRMLLEVVQPQSALMPEQAVSVPSLWVMTPYPVAPHQLRLAAGLVPALAAQTRQARNPSRSDNCPSYLLPPPTL
jgi:hypothetical protein